MLGVALVLFGVNQLLQWSSSRCRRMGVLVLSAQYLGNQRVTVELNGVEVARYASRKVLRNLVVDLPEGLLKIGDNNILRFYLPDAAPPGNGDPRALALALTSVEVY